MDIPVEPMHLAQLPKRLHHAFHGEIGTDGDGGAEEQALDVVAAVKLHGEIRHFVRREAGTGMSLDTRLTQ
jgi:hypothetical protein